MLLLGLAAALLLSLAPVVGRHLLGAAHQPLTGIDHIGEICLVALHLLLAPVHEAFHVLVGVGVAYAAWDRVRAWRRARRSLGLLDGTVPAPGDAFAVAAQAASLDPTRIRVVPGLPTPAFTAGWVSPIVYIARELAEGPRGLPPAELAAVIAHERAHVVRRDPLRFSVLRATAKTLFWIPALRGLADDVADEAEIRADDAAAAVVGPLTLASALVALAAWRPLGGNVLGEPAPDYAVGFALPLPGSGMRGLLGRSAVPFVRRDLLDRRVRRLAGEDTAPASRVTRRSLAWAALALGVVWTSGLVDVHELPHDAMAHVPYAAHCEHPTLSAFAHLFCRRGAHGGWITPGGTDCPHRTQPAATPPA